MPSVPERGSSWRPAFRPLAPRGRRLRAALARRTAASMLALGGLAVAAVATSAGIGSATESGRRAPVPGRVSVASGSAPLYRIVGCRSHGTAAYRHGPQAGVRAVALGFDDGPWTDTPAFVTMLEHARAPATFFLIGRQIARSDRSLLLRELRDGDALGDHTFSHPDMTLRGVNVRGQLGSTLGVILSLTGYRPCVWRPPYGAYDTAVLRISRLLGLATVMWNVDPRDWTRPGTRAIERRVLSEVQPGSIVISHDGGGPRGQTLAAYPAIIAALRRRGFRIETIPELLGFQPVYARCPQVCDGLGLPRPTLPRGAAVEGAPIASTPGAAPRTVALSLPTGTSDELSVPPMRP